ncbi:hypothetical protein GCM10023321_78300 [Pseudonocardia eucalypti]|uniref:RidA family protein n=1 Tax=Pseudonocardia eucalypti TaxID=648755 RepID=A0ABP9RB93_9PSEU|nr:enamine deaminase RidA (YjgF/YER057c/UK114 family) [Pseudonocardia eucalypti]
MMISRHNPPDAPPVARYSQVVRVDLGIAALLFVSGLVAVNGDGELVGRDDLAAQAGQVFANLRAVLASEGAGLEHVVKRTTFLRDGGDPAVLRRLDPFDDSALPSATGVVVKALFHPDWLVEVEAVAVVPTA